MPKDVLSMPTDPFRERLRDLLRRNDFSMKRASTAIGRNPAYLHQYLTREQPRVLGQRDTEALAKLLHCKPEELRHPTIPPRKRARRQRRRPPAGVPVAEIRSSPAMMPSRASRKTRRFRGKARGGTCPRRCCVRRPARTPRT